MKFFECMYSMRLIYNQSNDSKAERPRTLEKTKQNGNWFGEQTRSVHVTNPQTNHLVSEQQDSLDAELSRAEVEQILERRAKKLHNHDVVVTLDSEPFDLGNTD